MGQRHKPFYGWWVLATLFLSGFMVYGGGLYSFVLFITPWTREFGWSRATTAGLVSAFYFSYARLTDGKAVAATSPEEIQTAPNNVVAITPDSGADRRRHEIR